MFLTNQKIVLAKKETEYGVDPSPTVGANAIQAINPIVNYPSEPLERLIARQTLSPVQNVMGKIYAEMTFSVELKGSGSKGVAGQLSALLQACAYAETVSAGSSVIYSPASSPIESVTLYMYEYAVSGSAKLHKLLGAKGDWNLSISAGNIPMINFTFQGIYSAPTDVVNPSDPTYESSIPSIVESANFTLDGVTSLIAQEISLEIGNEIVRRDDVNSEQGIKSIEIIGRKPAGSMNPESVSVASYDFHTDLENATTVALSIVIGSSAGNKITITAPNVMIDTISMADRNGFISNDIPFKLSGDDNELVFKFE